jgi:hypothetical protein
MVPISLVAYCRQMFGFLHYFIGWLRTETGYGPMDRLAGVLWIMSGGLFLRSSDSVQLCRQLVEGYHVRGLLQEVYTGCTWIGMGSVRVVLIGFSLQGVYRFESPRLSDMSNRLFVAVITLLINGILFINEP